MSTPVPPITCHILDTTRGKPAKYVHCEISYLDKTTRKSFVFGTASTNDDGRIPQWKLINTTNFDSRKAEIGDKSEITIEDVATESQLDSIVDPNASAWVDVVPGDYKIRFYTASYFQSVAKAEGYTGDSLKQLGSSFFPFVDIYFVIPEIPDKHYHVPLLLSNHGYSTYRGS